LDVFEKVQQIRPEIEGAEGSLAAARILLVNEIQAERKPARSRATVRKWSFAVGLAGVAAVTAGVLIVNGLGSSVSTIDAVSTREPVETSAPSPSPSPSQPPVNASTVLATASGAAATGIVIAAGQYLRVDAVQRQLVSYNSIDGVNDLSVNRMNAESAWVLQTDTSIYIPADVSGTWVVDPERDDPIGDVFGPGGAADSERWAESLQAFDEPYFLPGGPDAGWVASWSSHGNAGGYGSLLASLPADATALIEWLRQQGAEPDKMGWILARMLSYNAGSPAQRAAMYSALSQLPGAELIYADDRTATIQYWTDGGDPSLPTLDWWRTVTIDRTTGYVTEYTERLGSNPALVPDSVPDAKYTYTVSVVDSAPSE